MFAYLIDDWTGQKKYLKEVDSLDLYLTQNGLSGRKIKLNRLHDLDASVRDLAENGARIFVAVGNDNTVSRLLNSLLKLENKFTLAVLPIGKNQQIAASFGCHNLEAAVAALKNRQTALIDLGLLNNRHYFITAAVLAGRASLGFLSYTVSSLQSAHEICFCNTNIFGQTSHWPGRKVFDCRDGTLEAVIARRPTKKSFWTKLATLPEAGRQYAVESIFPFKKIFVQCPTKTVKVMADTEKQLSTPVTVEVVPNKLEVVVAAAAGQ